MFSSHVCIVEFHVMVDRYILTFLYATKIYVMVHRCIFWFYVSSFWFILFLGMHRGILFNLTLVHFDNKSTRKKTSAKSFSRSMFFSYREHPLKPPQPIEEVVVDDCLKIFPNSSTRRYSTCGLPQH